MKDNIDLDQLTHEFLLSEGSRAGMDDAVDLNGVLLTANHWLAQLLNTSVGVGPRRYASNAKEQVTKARSRVRSENERHKTEIKALEEKIEELEERLLQHDAYEKLGE